MTRAFSSAPTPMLLNGNAVLPQADTIELLLKQSKRRGEAVPVRRAFVQDTENAVALVTKPGPLHKLVRHEKALDLLLLLYMVTSGGDFGAVERAETWGRATGLTFQHDGSAGSTVSRLWNRLAKLNLVERGTKGRLAKVTKLLEDGSGDPYTVPSGAEKGTRKDVYFRIPFEYWRNGLHTRLDLAGKVVMLIGMSLRDPSFSLPQTGTFAGYYGISEATLRRGIATLIRENVITKTGVEPYATNETVTGIGTRTLYAFEPPYDLNVNNETKAAREALLTLASTAATPVVDLSSPTVFAQPGSASKITADLFFAAADPQPKPAPMAETPTEGGEEK